MFWSSRELEGRVTVVALLSLACLLTNTHAGAVTVDSDAIDASAGPVSGAVLREYLARFGVTSPNSFIHAPTVVQAAQINAVSPTRNVFGGGDGLEPATLTLEFSPPVDNLSFVRTGVAFVRCCAGVT